MQLKRLFCSAVAAVALTAGAVPVAHAAPSPFPDTGSLGPGSSQPQPPATGAVIDVLVLYTPEVLKARGSAAAVEKAVRGGLTGMNDALKRSKIAGSVRLTHIEVTTAPESATGRGGDGLKWLYANATALRDRYRADLVSLVITGPEGMANLPGLPAGPGTAGSAFSVVGNDWLLPDLDRGEAGVFAHELGHNLGGMHDWGTSPQTGGNNPERHGYVSPKSHIDIMSYLTSSLCTQKCQRKPYYSNPDVMVDGEPFGVRGGDHPSDLASVFAKTIPAVAAYR